MDTPAPIPLSRPRPDGSLAQSMQTVTLPDGRKLGYAQFGPRGALPVFYFHGWPGSRLEAGFFNIHGVQMIGVDRPGYGLSDPHHNRTLADFPRDIEALADHLGLDRFAVVGMSGGGPYAAACAYHFGDRLHRAAIIAGLGPPDAPGMASNRVGFLLDLGQSPLRSTVLTNVMRTLIRLPATERHFERIKRNMPRASKDHEAMTPEFLRMLLASFREGLRASAKGPASDARIYGEPWHFSLKDIRVPVSIWHGTHDAQVPVSIGHHYAQNIPGARATFPDREGHVSIVTNYLEAIIGDLRAGP
ncbi:MAG: alpha/beta hydrolase [Alphaproteobacteria bacterium]|nr:alpha/beta hydrolase [Alphaproteobacteria bacterium]